MIFALLAAIGARASESVEIRAIEGAIAIDGSLGEPEWSSVRPVTQLVRYDPAEGGPPSGETEIRFLQDAHHLYVGIRVTGADYRVRARLSARESIDEDEVIGVALDTFHDGRSGSVFRVNPIGIQQDLRYVSGEWNGEWNAVWRSEGRLVEGGYEIEIAIPWASLKYPSAGEVQEWGVILTRSIPNEGATYAFPKLRVNTPVMFSEEAVLSGVRPSRGGSGLELVPALTLVPDIEPPPEGARFDVRDYNQVQATVRPSLDLRYGLSPDLSLTATLNPDFSQIESDVVDVRLNARFAYQFTELRPFFLDGAEFFDDTSETLYSRSVAEPLYGVKVAGRRGSVAVGALQTMDLSPQPSVHEHGTPGFDAEDVEGLWASTTVARAKGHVLDSGFLGMTLADKRVVASPEAPGARGYNDTVAVDAAVPVGRWTFAGAVAESIVSDGAHEAPWGQRADLSVIHGSGDGPGFRLQARHSTPGFRQETGFVTQTGLVDTYLGLDYTWALGQGSSTLRPYVEAAAFEENDGDGYRWAGVGSVLVVDGVHALWSNGEIVRQDQTGATVDGWSGSGGYEGAFGRSFGILAEGEAAQTMDFGTLAPARQLSGSLAAVVRPLNPFRAELSLMGQRHHPILSVPERSRFVRGRVDWQISRRLGLRGIAQEGWVEAPPESRRSRLGSVLLSWLDVPGNAVYLGWTARSSGAAQTEHLLFAKLSVLVRP